MKRTVIVGVVLLLAVAAAGYAWWRRHEESASDELKLYGNVDLRQIDLAFNNSQRIREILVQEGDRVVKGQRLASLDTGRLEPQVAQAEAQVEAQRQAVQRLHNGSRPEEIAQARANVASAEADAANARRQFERLETLAAQSKGGAVSQQDLDNARAALSVANARLEVNEKALELAVVGPRKEDVAEAESRLRANEAQLDLLRQELSDAQLIAPTAATVRSRIMEPGEMASPQRPALMLAVTDPKWIRAHVSETDLGHIKPGMRATVGVDSFPDRRFNGWIGFISPVAEFTPKAVQTEELRTSLVYEVRVFVNDPQDELRLGMPATIYLSLVQDGSPEPTKVPGTADAPPEVSAAPVPARDEVRSDPSATR